ncbi:VOC family protein [Brevibacterium album]|uniref:VOC family protein n=1 Tax=Brevibacterium album TaxID=417948 RepID=UPI000427E5A7|nr:VOC family protein [Brevibacterium album]
MAVTPFLMFEGRAQEAIDLYTAVIPRSSVESVAHFPAEQIAQTAEIANEANPAVEAAGPLIMMAVVSLDGQRVRVNDSPIHHQFTFTPASSLYFETEDPAEYEAVLAALGEGGGFLMEDRDDYGFAQRYAWLADRFGVSWQLALASAV